MPDKTRSLVWPERVRGAVSLSYDGGDISHYETAASCLDALCLRATFYAPPERVLRSPAAWRAVAAVGHEIGNASLFEAAGSDGLLDGWTQQMLENDLRMASEFYRDFLPNGERHSFAHPLPDLDGPDRRLALARQFEQLGPLIRARFAVARGTTDGFNSPTSCDLRALRCFSVLDFSFEELVVLAESAIDARAWAIFAFNGVGVGEPAVDAVDHAKFCLWLAERRDQILVAPVYDMGMRIREATSAAVKVGEREESPSQLGRMA
jgi:hypothetical protein